MIFLRHFKKYIQLNNLFHPKDKLLLAVSGGVDSIVLCELCKQAGFDFVIAHCNFQLRDEESERDEMFVKELGKRYNVEVFVKKFDTINYAKDNKISIQVAARELRYNWFNELLTSDSILPTPHWLLTAHHLGDNIETMLMNFFKGTGIAGLRGILSKQGKIIRPLLFARREEILAFAKENNLSWVEDSSNESDKYSRNYIRHQVIPVIEKIYPEAESNLAENLQRFRDIENLYQQSISLHKKKLCEQKGNEIHIPVLKLKKTEAIHSIVYEIIKDFGFHAAHVNEVINLLDSESGRYIASPMHRIIKNRNWLIIAPVVTEEAENILIDRDILNVKFAGGSLQLEQLSTHDSPLTTHHSSAQLDLKQIHFPLLLRKWKAGDYFYPLGMKKKKKLARFFIDQKLSKTEKEKVWVIESDKRIVWIVGHRIDDRFKITGQTNDVLKITLS